MMNEWDISKDFYHNNSIIVPLPADVLFKSLITELACLARC